MQVVETAQALTTESELLFHRLTFVPRYLGTYQIIELHEHTPNRELFP